MGSRPDFNDVLTGDLPARLRQRAEQIDFRLGPIPGNIADKLAKELREAAAAIERLPAQT